MIDRELRLISAGPPDSEYCPNHEGEGEPCCPEGNCKLNQVSSIRPCSRSAPSQSLLVPASGHIPNLEKLLSRLVTIAELSSQKVPHPPKTSASLPAAGPEIHLLRDGV